MEVIRPLLARRKFSNRIRSVWRVSLSIAILAKSSVERVADSIGISVCG